MKEITILRKMYFEDGENISQISKKKGYDRKTIRKFIQKDDWNEEVKVSTTKESKIDRFKHEIDQWLEGDKQMRKKQRHTAKRVFDRLKEKYKNELNISYRTVAQYVAEKKKILYGNKQFFLPLEHKPGEAQIDFGKAEFIENGTRYYGSYINVSFPFSNAGFMQLFKGENFECLSEGLRNIFEHINGVPHRQWYDNMSTAVKKILKGNKRELTDSFIKLKEHYNFNAVFCNKNSGNEKGNVENKVGYLRRNFLVPMPEFSDLSEYNIELLERCDYDLKRKHYRKDKLISNLFQEDKSHCNPLPTVAFETNTYESVLVDSYGKFTLEQGNHSYSSMPRLVGDRVTIRKDANKVYVLNEKMEVVVTHKRLYGKQKQESMDWIPYLSQLSRKPAALKYTGIYELLPNPLQQWLDQIDSSGKSKTLKLLSDLTQKSSFTAAVNAFQVALENDTTDIESFIELHTRLTNDIPELRQLELTSSALQIDKLNLDLEQYDRILLTGGAANVSH
jgi:transposase